VAELSLGTIVSICFFQESVFSSVSPRNFVVEVTDSDPVNPLELNVICF